ncbi:MAG: class B sortase, partial [Coriobacteriaceae bacterium]|nr:class B sortase [Coriobacteriaceae bacterium]
RAEKPSNASEADSEPDSLVDNPVDFLALQQENPDIYAWIQVPGTNVNYPVVQHPTDDDYYLTHNRDNEVSPEGAIYSQLANNTDFRDPVTLLYGHNNVNEAMFSTLHYFGNADFFAANDTFYIYTQDHILTYRIISAYIYDDRHILKSFDFKKPNVVLDYFAFVAQPDSLLANARPDTKLTISDKIVQLSTCMSDPLQANSRFLVNGVLIDDQPTY